MPIMSGSTAVAANSRSSNVLAGQQFEFSPATSKISLRCTTTATGINADFSIGGEQLITDALISNANRYPIQPDDILIESSAAGGERLFLTFRNTTAGALTVTWVIELTPI